MKNEGLNWKTVVSPLTEKFIEKKRNLKDFFIFGMKFNLFGFFWRSVSFEIGDGKSTSLWYNNWGKGILYQEKPNLFKEAIKQNGTIYQF